MQLMSPQQNRTGIPEGSMHIHRLKVVVLAAVAAATLALAVAPSKAQTTPVQTAAVKKRPTQVAITTRPPAKVTVRKRSYLDPGTETKARDEHYQDYAYPPGGNSAVMNSTLFNSGPGLPVTNNRMPFPNCFDLGGFCR
jgi:hypothetical protein